jgi:hypothetical protein
LATARAKSTDIARCGFSHSACGHAFSYRADRAGYRWTRLGENIAFGTGSASVRAIFSAWLRSTEDRANILDPAFRDVGRRLAPGEGRRRERAILGGRVRPPLSSAIQDAGGAAQAASTCHPTVGSAALRQLVTT